ncbi:MAG: STAS domain-containing protein [Gammaproteobacteria bacterium]|nr:STAS domain-containing protein [Gammaproteobacteria bacterium]
MDIKRDFEDSNRKVTIKVQGRFVFGLHKEFRNAYRDLDGATKEYEVDLSQAVYLDSAALGMLLLLQEHANTFSAKVSIVGATPDVRRILDIGRIQLRSA